MICYRTSSGWSVLWDTSGFVDFDDVDDWAALGLRLVPADECPAELLPHVRIVLRSRDGEYQRLRDVHVAVPVRVR